MSYKIKNSAITPLIAQLLRNDPDAMNDGIQQVPLNALEEMTDAWIQQIRADTLQDKFFANTAPEVPTDETPVKKYPKTQTAPTPAPDAAETEGMRSTKPSTPEYDLFKAGVVGLLDAGKSLFELESEDEQDKDDARRRAFDALQPVREAIWIL